LLDPKGASANHPPGSAVQTLGTLIKVVIVAILVSLTLTVLMLLHAGRIQDETAAEASLRQIDGLLLMTGRNLANHVRDYAAWNEAIERVLLARDADWWDANPGRTALSTFDLSLTLAADGSDRVYFISTPDGTRSAPSDLMLGPSTKALLDKERRSLRLCSATCNDGADRAGRSHLLGGNKPIPPRRGFQRRLPNPPVPCCSSRSHSTTR
jgi:hypothetical protein